MTVSQWNGVGWRCSYQRDDYSVCFNVATHDNQTHCERHARWSLPDAVVVDQFGTNPENWA